MGELEVELRKLPAVFIKQETASTQIPPVLQENAWGRTGSIVVSEESKALPSSLLIVKRRVCLCFPRWQPLASCGYLNKLNKMKFQLLLGLMAKIRCQMNISVSQHRILSVQWPSISVIESSFGCPGYLSPSKRWGEGMYTCRGPGGQGI